MAVSGLFHKKAKSLWNFPEQVNEIWQLYNSQINILNSLAIENTSLSENINSPSL